MNGFTINVCLWGLHGAIIQGRLVFVRVFFLMWISHRPDQFCVVLDFVGLCVFLWPVVPGDLVNVAINT